MRLFMTYIKEVQTYNDAIKNRLYFELADSYERRSAQSALFQIILVTTRLMSPIITFLCEELEEYYLKQYKTESIHLQPIIIFKFSSGQQALKNTLEQIRKVLCKALDKQQQKVNAGWHGDTKALILLKMGTTQADAFFKDIAHFELGQYFLHDYFRVADIKIEENRSSNDIVSVTDDLKCPPWMSLVLEDLKCSKCARCWRLPKVINSEFCGRCATLKGVDDDPQNENEEEL